MEQVKVEAAIRSWQQKVSRLQALHMHAANKYRNRHIALGVSAITISAISAGSLFSGWSDATLARQLSSAFATLATILITLQTFLDYGGLSERHRNTASKSGSIRRKIELLLVGPPQDGYELRKYADELNALISDVSDGEPIFLVNEKTAEAMEDVVMFCRRKS